MKTILSTLSTMIKAYGPMCSLRAAAYQTCLHTQSVVQAFGNCFIQGQLSPSHYPAAAPLLQTCMRQVNHKNNTSRNKNLFWSVVFYQSLYRILSWKVVVKCCCLSSDHTCHQPAYRIGHSWLCLGRLDGGQSYNTIMLRVPIKQLGNLLNLMKANPSFVNNFGL